MAPQKETIMVLKVDLDCSRCYRKVKKLLCQFPQVHDQIYNEKQNSVMIKVICCSPEKIREKLCCKGGKSIKSIEILEPKKPPPPPPDPGPAPPPPPVEKPLPPPAEKIKKNGSKKIEAPPEPDPEPSKPDPPPQKPAAPPPVPQADPVQCQPVYQMGPVNMCCPECYSGYRTGPCYHGSGYGAPPPAFEWGYYGGGYPPPPPPGYGGYNNYKPGYCVSRCGDYISDENPTACVIM